MILGQKAGSPAVPL